jgi:hypothetical protein
MFSDVITSEEQLRAILGLPSHRVLAKHVSSLDRHCRDFIARSPFLLVASADGDGAMDISPKGDPPGFVQVLDDTTLAIPERLGNRKADTFSNLLQNSRVGLLFLIPGKQETLRVSGRATIVRDRWLRDRFVVSDNTPELVLIVAVEEVFFHCTKCMLRSRLWDVSHWPDLSGLPTLARAMVDAGRLTETVEEMQGLIDEDISQRLY